MADWNDTGIVVAVPGANKRPVAPEPDCILDVQRSALFKNEESTQEDLI